MATQKKHTLNNILSLTHSPRLDMPKPPGRIIEWGGMQVGRLRRRNENGEEEEEGKEVDEV